MPKVGTLERRSPLPQGQYWVDVFGQNIPKFDRWLKAYSGMGVHTDATQTFESSNPSETRNWYKFSYVPIPGAIVIWDSTLGYPTVADASITSSDDTVQRPDLPLDPLEELGNWVNSVEQKLGGSLGGLAVIFPFALVGTGLYVGYRLLTNSITTSRKAKKVGKRSSHD